MSNIKNTFSFDGSDSDTFSKGLGDITREKQEREAQNYLTPEEYTVTDWEKDELVQSSFEILTEYLTKEKGMGNYLFDQATTGQETDPAEFMRDLTMRLGAPLATAKALEDAPEKVKESFRIMKSRWDKAEVKGGKEQLDRVLDYGADLVFSPEGLATIGGLLSGVSTFGISSAATVASRKLAQTQATKALMNAVKATKAATTKNPLKATALISSTYGGAASHLAQELDIAADIKKEEDYSLGEVAFGTVAGGVLGPVAVKGLGLLGQGGKMAASYFREGTRVPKEISLREAKQVFDEGIEGEWIPASGEELIGKVQKLLEGTTTTLKSITPKEVIVVANKFAEDLGGGEKTRADILRIIRAAADAEDTVDGKTNKLIQGLYVVASDISGNFFGKAAGVLSPITKFSGTASQLQKKLSHEFAVKYKTQDKIVEKDLSEVQREITGKYNERFRAIVDELSLSEIDTKLAEEMNAALSLSLRSTKAVKHSGFDDNANRAIDTAAKEIKSLYNEMGVKLNDIGIIDTLVENYVPRMWKRSAIEKDPTKLIDLFVNKAGMSKVEARRTVNNMLDIKNQVDEGTGGGYFFSSKRKIDTIANDADFEEFLNNDVLGSLHAYTYQAGKSLAKHRVLGVNNFDQFKKFYISRIREEMTEAGEQFTPKIERQIEKLYRSATGEGMERYGKTAQNVVDGYSFANRVGLLGLATLSSLTEVMINLGKAGVVNSAKGFGDAIKKSHKTITKDLETKLQTEHGLTAKEALAEMRSFSIHVDQALAQVGDRLAGDELVSETLQQASNKFFRLNMLDQWTKFVQSVSFSSGKHLVNDNIKKLSSYGSRPLDKTGETLVGELAELGIDHKKSLAWYKAGAKTDDEFYKTDILGGVARYTNSVVLQPTAMSGLKPLLYSNPKTSVMFQLLSYPVAFTNTVLKGAAKQIVKNPKRNAGKLLAAGTIMTGMARWTNYARTGGQNEEGKETSEILRDAVARWGGNGILLDSLQRAQTAAKYSRSNLAYATLPFGPAASDSLSMIQQGIIPTVGNKVPVVSGSYFGRQILGDEKVTHYRRSLKKKQKEIFGEFIPDFDDETKLPGYALGGAVSALSKLAVKSIAKSGEDKVSSRGEIIQKVTEGLIDSKVINKTSQDLEGDLNLIRNSESSSDYNLEDFADAAVTVEFKKEYKSITELEANPAWKKAMLSETEKDSQINWDKARTSMGFDDDYKLSLQTIEELQDSVGSSEAIRNTVASNLNSIKNIYSKLKIDISPEDRSKAALSKFDENSLDATHDFLTQIVKDKEPLVSEEGALTVAKNAIIKIAASGEVDFSKFKAPKLSVLKKADESLDGAEGKINEYLQGSFEKEKVYRAVQTFKDSEFNVAFTFSREMGTHVGTKGVSQTVKLRDMLFEVYDENKASEIYIKFKNKRPEQAEYNKMFESLEKVAKSKFGDDYKFKESEMQEGYINVKNPLMYRGETAESVWAADKILAGLDGVNELLGNIKSSGVEVTPKILSSIKKLRERAKQLQTRSEDSMLEKLKTDLMKYELTIDLRTELQGMGFDSVKYVNEIEHGFKGESKYSYILFEPEQFKFTNSAKFDANDPRHAFVIGGLAAKLAPKLASGFFSKAQKEALKLEQKTGTGTVMLKRLEDKGVAKEELEWTGAKEKFEGKPEVTREELQQHFKDTEFDVEVKEGKYTEKSSYARDESDLDLPEDTFEMSKDDEFWEWVEENRPHDLDMIDEGTITGKEFDSWYDETKVEWEKGRGSSDEPDFDVVPMHLDFAFEGRDTKNYRELPILLKKRFKKSKEDFVHPHFPTLENPIAHIRLADVEPVKRDSKILLIDEIQSDVHQMGRDKVVPNMPFKNEKKWALLGLKKAMMEAAEGGYDEVALTTGSMQGNRNNQISKIDTALLSEYKSGLKRIDFFDKEGNIFKIISNEKEGYGAVGEAYLDEAAKIIGKENVDKLLSKPIFRKENQSEFIRAGSGEMKILEDLEIEKGGEKMKQFYDKTLMKLLKTNFADKYNVNIKIKEIKQNEGVVKLPVMKITEKMREDILTGLPMFAEGGEVDEDVIIQKAESVSQEEPVVAVSNQPTKGSIITALKANLNKGE